MTIVKMTIQAAEERANAARLRVTSLDIEQRRFVLDVQRCTKQLSSLSGRINSIRQKLGESK